MKKKSGASVKISKSKGSLDPRARICKADSCSTPSQVKGYCRLHYLVVLKKEREDALNARDLVAEKLDERRKSNRLEGPDARDALPTDWAPEEVVENIERLDSQPTTLLDTDDLDPFKKTG